MVRVSWAEISGDYEERKSYDRRGVVVGWTSNSSGTTYAVVMVDGYFEDVPIGKLKFESWVD